MKNVEHKNVEIEQRLNYAFSVIIKKIDFYKSYLLWLKEKEEGAYNENDLSLSYYEDRIDYTEDFINDLECILNSLK